LIILGRYRVIAEDHKRYYIIFADFYEKSQGLDMGRQESHRGKPAAAQRTRSGRARYWRATFPANMTRRQRSSPSGSAECYRVGVALSHWPASDNDAVPV
jgi:hypothetical protein